MSPRHFLVPAYLVLCVLLGGASLGGYMGNLILQLIALPIIVWAFVRPQSMRSTASRQLMALAALGIAMLLVQLVPLPPSIWTSLPERAAVAEGFAMLGQDLPWLPLSLDPNRTLAALLWLLPAFAGLVGVIRLGAYRNSVLAWTLIAVAISSVLLGALQITGGRDSAFYIYEVTNFGLGVGYFANSNHQAILLVATIAFVAALFIRREKARSAKGASGLMIVLTGIALVLMVGVVIGGSLAGLALGAVVGVASLLMVRYRGVRVPAAALLGGIAALAAGIVLLFQSPTGGGALIRDAQTSTYSREIMIGTTATAAGDYFPAGSGAGTFPIIYRTYEDPAGITTMWVNHAHSDVVEIVLETGLPGIILMVLFLLWWCRRAYALWVGVERPDHFGRAAVIASAAIIAHSFVDYPLRTAAVSTLFAVCLALMADPRPAVRSKRQADDAGEVRHLSA